MVDYPCAGPIEEEGGSVLPSQVPEREELYREEALRPSTQSVIAKHFSSIPLFADCSKRELKQLCRTAVVEHRAAGATLVTQGQPGTDAFVLLQGTCRVLRNGRRVGKVEPGSVIGELSMLTRAPRNASVVAQTPLEVAVLSRRDFLALLDKSPSITRKLLDRLATRVQELDAQTCS
jgi:CRP-like cAMP-binding protein